jgi:hypothetical protein
MANISLDLNSRVTTRRANFTLETKEGITYTGSVQVKKIFRTKQIECVFDWQRKRIDADVIIEENITKEEEAQLAKFEEEIATELLKQ